MRKFEPGAVVCVYRGLALHYGIADKDKKVIDRMPDGGIARRTLAEFSNGHEVREIPIPHRRFGYAQTIERAVARIGEVGYNFFDRNCEHFVSECALGRAHSHQVWLGLGIGAAGVAAYVAAESPNLRTAALIGFLGLAAYLCLSKPENVNLVPYEATA